MSAEIVTNRKALRDYHILETFEAGIELKGTEVESIRSGLVNLQGSYARIEGGEVFLYDSDIQPYLRASHEQHEPRRRRRLLLHRAEIDKLAGETEQAGHTLIALKMYLEKRAGENFPGRWQGQGRCRQAGRPQEACSGERGATRSRGHPAQKIAREALAASLSLSRRLFFDGACQKRDCL